LASAEHYKQVAKVLSERPDAAQAVVVSAMGGMTDALLACVALAADSQPYDEALSALLNRQSEAFSELLGDDGQAVLEDARTDIGNVLQATRLTGRAEQPVLDLVSGFGEQWSARLLTEYLKTTGHQASFVDARDILRVSHGEMGPAVDWPACQHRLDQMLANDSSELLVITGYIAADTQGRPTTLGRNGSDFSAAIFGRLLAASGIHIWTDVDGVMSADPRLVPGARVIDSLSFDEALELAYFGARVIHPQTLSPAIEAGISIDIRNTFNPQGGGSRIGSETDSQFQIKGISTIDDLTLINLEGAGMIGVPGTARRVFGALKRAAISVVMISQGSSEHSICFVVRSADAELAAARVEEEFEDELRQRHIHSVSCTPEISVLAVVGDAMAGHPGIAARFFSALADAGINVRAIAQGSSERNISAVIDTGLATRAVRAVHGAFYLSPQTLSVGIIGVGNVGGELIDQLAGEQDRLQREVGVVLRVRAIADSKRMLLIEPTLELADWRETFAREAVDLDPDELEQHVHADHLPHAVMIDCTANARVAARHADWLARGMHVVTPNKKANSASLAEYLAIQAAISGGAGRYYYETTVGAGLPVIHTLRDLRQTGDKIRAIEGIFSGTLAYLFNRFDGSAPFSSLVREAWQQGFTEPDPRDDLSGMDVARKTVILAREMGLELEVEDLELENLVPASLADCSAEDFIAGLSDYDDQMLLRLTEARGRDSVLRYVGRLEASGATRIGLMELPMDHPFAHANLTDNVVQFVTDRYCDNPLVVQGPGAGPAVTAAGVFADLLRLCTSLGARI
jgi:aspartokinase/homoserine dehydrogenase 1